MDAPPAEVIQGLWRDIDVADPGALEAEAHVSVVAVGDPAPGLAEALGAQTYPADLIELAAGEPEGDVVIFLPVGARPEPELVAAHARWQHAAGDVVSLGSVAPAGADADAPLGLVRDTTRDFTDLGGSLHLAAADGTFATAASSTRPRARGSAPGELLLVDLLYRLHCAERSSPPSRWRVRSGPPGTSPTRSRAPSGRGGRWSSSCPRSPR